MNKPKKTWLSLLLIFAVSFTTVFGSVGFVQAASYDKTKLPLKHAETICITKTKHRASAR